MVTLQDLGLSSNQWSLTLTVLYFPYMAAEVCTAWRLPLARAGRAVLTERSTSTLVPSGGLTSTRSRPT